MAPGNLGKTKNSGYEIELKHSNHIGNDFIYNIGFTYSHAKNEILNMDEPTLKPNIVNVKDIQSISTLVYSVMDLLHKKI